MLAAVARDVSIRRPVVIADRGAAEAGVLDLIEIEALDVLLVDPDPGIGEVEGAAGAARRLGADGVIAVGGGSALAVGKATSILLTNDGESVAELEGTVAVPREPAPTIAVPTTAGSGSEVSKVLVLHDASRKDGLSLRVEGSQPRVALLDAAVLRAAPRSVFLHSGLDALSHAIESLWAKRATLYSRAVAYEAAQRMIDALPEAVDGADSGRNQSGENDAALMRLLEGSTAANVSCGNSGLGLAHAFAASDAVRLPHGLRTGIMLPHIADFNRSAMADPRAEAIIDQLEEFYARLGIEASFPTGAVSAAESAAMVAAAKEHPFRANNIRESTEEDLYRLLSLAGAPAPD